jgi:hypothetical protein
VTVDESKTHKAFANLVARAELAAEFAKPALAAFVPKAASAEASIFPDPALGSYLVSANGKTDLQEVVKSSVVPAKPNTPIFYGSSVPANGQKVEVDSLGGKLMVERDAQGKATIAGVAITNADATLAANGVIHETSGIVIPSTFKFTPSKKLTGLGASRLGRLLAFLLHDLDSKVDFSKEYTLIGFPDTIGKEYTSIDYAGGDERKVAALNGWLKNYIVKGKISAIPKPWNKVELKNLNGETLVLNGDLISIGKGAGRREAKFIDGPMGKSAYGDYAEVQLIDSVLIPAPRDAPAPTPVAPQVPVAPKAPVAPTPTPNQAAKSDGPNVGLIVGLVCGGIGLLAFIAVVVFFIRKRRAAAHKYQAVDAK